MANGFDTMVDESNKEDGNNLTGDSTYTKTILVRPPQTEHNGSDVRKDFRSDEFIHIKQQK